MEWSLARVPHKLCLEADSEDMSNTNPERIKENAMWLQHREGKHLPQNATGRGPAFVCTLHEHQQLCPWLVPSWYHPSKAGTFVLAQKRESELRFLPPTLANNLPCAGAKTALLAPSGTIGSQVLFYFTLTSSELKIGFFIFQRKKPLHLILYAKNQVTGE